jgi:peptide-methionine (S)-S-oxide reductase
MEIATLGGGCFWCLDALYSQVKGVSQVLVGYAGGNAANPTYKQVSYGNTGHAEVVQLTFDPSVITYREILEIFFEIHDPTTLNRQGNDIGPQYRSIILYHSPQQKEIAEAIIAELNTSGKWNKPIVTELKEYDRFYVAEEYHQKYFEKNPDQGYCKLVISPKVEKFKKKFSLILR